MKIHSLADEPSIKAEILKSKNQFVNEYLRKEDMK